VDQSQLIAPDKGTSMHAAFLLGLLASSHLPSELQKIADPFTLQIALERSQWLAEQLLIVLPDNVKNSPRPRVEAMIADIRRDRAKLAREGRSPLFEAAVFVHYGDAMRLANEYLSSNRMHFDAVRAVGHDDVQMANGNLNGNGNGKNGKVTFVDTLFTHIELQEIARKTHEMIDSLSTKDHLDSFRNAKWRKAVAKVNYDLRKAEDEIRLPSEQSKVGPEARLLALYAKVVSMTIVEGTKSKSDR
jgi:hypothetical protein